MITFSDEDKKRLRDTNCVDNREDWLIDFWGNKNIKGLLGIPFSRHYIMHLEASIRIIKRIK